MTFLEIMKIDAYHFVRRPCEPVRPHTPCLPPNPTDTSDKPHVLTSDLEPLTKPAVGSSEPRYFERF